MGYVAVGTVAETGYGDKGDQVAVAWERAKLATECAVAGGTWDATNYVCMMPGATTPKPGTAPPPPPPGQPQPVTGLCLSQWIYVPPPPGLAYCRNDCPPGGIQSVDAPTGQRVCVDPSWAGTVPPIPGVTGGGGGTPPSMPPPQTTPPPQTQPPPVTPPPAAKAGIFGLPPLALAAIGGAVVILGVAMATKKRKQKGAAK